MPSITPSGPETLVNTNVADNQINPVVAALSGGRYIVVWTGPVQTGANPNASYANADIRAQLFNADGSRAGGEFVVNASTAGPQLRPAVTELSDGHILIAWQYNIGSLSNPASSGAAITLAQEFTGNGVAIGPEFQISSGGEAIATVITPLAGGGFFAVWQQGRAGNIVGQVFDSNNAPTGSPIVIDDTDKAPYATPRVATLGDGSVVVAWRNNEPSTVGVFSTRLYSAAGSALSNEVVFGGANYYGDLGSLIPLTNGGFAISDQRFFASGGSYFEYWRFSSNAVLNDRIDLQGVNSNDVAVITPLSFGGIAAVWAGTNNGATGYDIYSQTYNTAGLAIGPRYTVNLNTPSDQYLPSIANLSTGNIVVAWVDESGLLGGSGIDIRTRLINYNSANTNPIANNSTIYLSMISNGGPAGPFNVYDGQTVALTAFNSGFVRDSTSDIDGDTITPLSIQNVTNGSAVLNSDGSVTARHDVGAPGPLSFDYTVTDGNGGTATAHQTFVFVNDVVSIRGASPTINFLANDYLAARPQGYQFLGFAVVQGGAFGQLKFVGSNELSQILFDLSGTSYTNLQIGQSETAKITVFVMNPLTGLADYVSEITATLDGWAQIGGTERDVLIGSSLPDSLQGGSGSANELYGGAGDDLYTVSAQGDTIIELSGGGIDSVRTTLLSFTLAPNVENLLSTAGSSFLGVGNAENNFISARFALDGVVLVGLDGNDTLSIRPLAIGELIGGPGDDIYIFGNASTTVVEFAGEGTDEVRIDDNYTLGPNVENLTYTGGQSFTGTGNALDNVITGGSERASTLIGLGGNDTYVVRNAGDSIVEAAAGGTDTVQTALAFYRLNAANVENLTYTGTGNFTGIGNAENNVITGGAGADYLYAGAGTDTLTGGAGADVFLFDTAVNGVDSISDFTSGSDRLFFNQTVFTHTPTFALVQGAGAQVATTANSAFLYNSTTGALSFDADGNGAGAAIAVANLTPGLTLTQADFVFYG